MIEYQIETLDEILEELEPLLEEHYYEVAMYQDRIQLNPNYDFYRTAEQNGSLLIWTGRDNGALVAYCITFLQFNPHYQDHLYAVNDVIYVCPEYRHGETAIELIQGLQEKLKQYEVSVMTFHMKTFKPFETLMKALNFDKAEYLYTKYIKED
tara:strand:+ start:1235 stop:1693 length:459 start_codon:yes stop_codon:yes gene_type:complete